MYIFPKLNITFGHYLYINNDKNDVIIYNAFNLIYNLLNKIKSWMNQHNKVLFKTKKCCVHDFYIRTEASINVI